MAASVPRRPPRPRRSVSPVKRASSLRLHQSEPPPQKQARLELPPPQKQARLDQPTPPLQQPPPPKPAQQQQPPKPAQQQQQQQQQTELLVQQQVELLVQQQQQHQQLLQQEREQLQQTEQLMQLLADGSLHQAGPWAPEDAASGQLPPACPSPPDPQQLPASFFALADVFSGPGPREAGALPAPGRAAGGGVGGGGGSEAGSVGGDPTDLFAQQEQLMFLLLQQQQQHQQQQHQQQQQQMALGPGLGPGGVGLGQVQHANMWAAPAAMQRAGSSNMDGGGGGGALQSFNSLPIAMGEGGGRGMGQS
jgi:hypothetical protein